MDEETLYRAVRARDLRFDGKFFVGVKTTGIYCRPICPAQPKRQNLRFFPTALAAEQAGFRPCLRCRPEAAPLSPAWHGTSAIVNLALKSLAAHGLTDSEESFAGKFGVSARHLRRLFISEIGQTPKQIADLQRLNFARQLLAESGLPVTQVALTAGFRSLRRFNSAFKARFARPPSAYRTTRLKPSDLDVHLTLSYRPPLDWSAVLGFFRSHRIAGVESVEDSSYSRVFRLDGQTGRLTVMPHAQSGKLSLRIQGASPQIYFTIASRVRQMFDLDSDPLLVANAFRGDRELNALWMRFPGLRVARGWDPFEMAIVTILGQLVSVQQARSLVAQLVYAYGEPVEGGLIFPSPERLAVADLLEVGTTERRRHTIRELARRVASGELNFTVPQDSQTMRAALRAIPGLGQWSVEYICLRALGDTDAFPATDLVLHRALAHYPHVDFAQIKPWRAYAAIYLWRDHQERKESSYAVQKNQLSHRKNHPGGQRKRSTASAVGK